MQGKRKDLNRLRYGTKVNGSSEGGGRVRRRPNKISDGVYALDTKYKRVLEHDATSITIRFRRNNDAASTAVGFHDARRTIRRHILYYYYYERNKKTKTKQIIAESDAVRIIWLAECRRGNFRLSSRVRAYAWRRFLGHRSLFNSIDVFTASRFRLAARQDFASH